MKRRGDEIKDLISQHTHAYIYDIDRYDEDVIVSSVMSMVISQFIVNNDLDADDDVEYDWVHMFIEDHYKDYIKKELGL
jgi:dipeptidase